MTVNLIKSALIAISLSAAAPAFADCSFNDARALTIQRIGEYAAKQNYVYGDVKLALFKDNLTLVTKVLMTFKATPLRDYSAADTYLGYSYFDQDCNSIESLITNGGNAFN